tara:strand:+ start:258 stop:827 length:570 start_codon:yes stop_codon:yes gene_type:complete
MKLIRISDPEKGEINYNLENTITIGEFNNIISSMSRKLSLTKVADIKLARDRAPGYIYENKSKIWHHENEGFTYCITVNDKIVKIGMTEKSLVSRFSSYQAGTKKARNKGTCSVTNYYCSEFIREALASDMKVEIYAYHVPTKYIETNILGTNHKLVAKQAYAYEDALLSLYKEQKGEVPALCRNTSLT